MTTKLRCPIHGEVDFAKIKDEVMVISIFQVSMRYEVVSKEQYLQATWNKPVDAVPVGEDHEVYYNTTGGEIVDSDEDSSCAELRCAKAHNVVPNSPCGELLQEYEAV